MKFSVVGSYKYIISNWNNIIVLYITQYLEHIYSPVKNICKNMFMKMEWQKISMTTAINTPKSVTQDS